MQTVDDSQQKHETDDSTEFKPPLITHVNREVFEINGRKFLSKPTIQELLIEAGIINTRIYRSILREFQHQGVATIDDLFDFSKSKILHLESFSQENATKLVKHLMLVKHKGQLLVTGDKLETLEEEYYYLEFVKEIDGMLFNHMNGMQGLRSQSLIEICGSDGVGKTQWCMTATCSMLQVGKRVIYVDSEEGFNYPRIKQIAIENKL